MKHAKVGLVVPVLNNHEGLSELLASVKSKHHVQVYVQPQWRAQVPLSAAWNEGIREATRGACEYILISNDDVILAPFAIDALVSELKRLSGEGVILTSANNILGLLANPLDILTYEEKQKPPLVADHPNYACFLVGVDFVDKVGWFDENFDPAWKEDQDSHRRIQLLGYRAISTTAAPSVHIGSVTTAKLGHADSTKSHNYYRAKWGGDWNCEAFATPYNDPALTARDWTPNYGG